MVKPYSAVFYLLVLGALPLSLSEAGNIYRYQDAQGNWHFTDRKPDNTVVEKLDYRHQPNNQEPRLDVRQINGDWALIAINPYAGPVELAVLLDSSSNTIHRQVLAADSEIVIHRPLAHGRVQFEYQYIAGDPTAQPDGSVYRLPVAANSLYHISQGFNGHFSHNREPNRYAIDIELPVGTEILAAREGVVMTVIDDYVMDGTDDYFADKANMILVLHEDGTIGVYAHLLHGGARVSVGDRVETGQLLGLSGSTGFSTGPHLHFVVWRNAGMQYQSVPIQFVDHNNRPWQPRQGKSLAAE